MRYEQLLNCDAKIKALEAIQDLEHRRRCCVAKFLSFREQMIREQTLTTVDSDLPLRLMNLFQDDNNVHYDDGSANNENSTVIERMQKFDRLLLSGINKITNKSSVSYKMKDTSGLHGIALSQSGTALVEMDLASDENMIQSHVLRICFASESDHIQSVATLPLARSCMTNFNPSSAKNERQQNLEEQISYPSVVSFDVERDSRKLFNNVDDKRCEGDDGVGMSF